DRNVYDEIAAADVHVFRPSSHRLRKRQIPRAILDRDSSRGFVLREQHARSKDERTNQQDYLPLHAISPLENHGPVQLCRALECDVTAALEKGARCSDKWATTNAALHRKSERLS